jgi:hypothetical protein
MAAASLVLGLGIGAGATFAISSSNTNTPSDASASASAAPEASQPPKVASPEDTAKGKTQEGAKATVDAFLKQVATDLPEYEKGLSGKKTVPEQDAVFMEKFAKSITFLKKGSFTPEQTKAMVGSFAQLYIYDKDAKIESEASSYALDGDTAVIKGTDFKLIIGGKVQEQQPDPSGKELEDDDLLRERQVVHQWV